MPFNLVKLGPQYSSCLTLDGLCHTVRRDREGAIWDIRRGFGGISTGSIRVGWANS
jgi:hypothetical protein